MSAIQVTVNSGLDWPAVALDFLTFGLAIGTVYLATEDEEVGRRDSAVGGGGTSRG